MGILEAIAGILKSLPEILNLVNRLVNQFQEAKRQGVINDINTALDKSEAAKTPQERSRAMLDLVRAVSRPR